MFFSTRLSSRWPMTRYQTSMVPLTNRRSSLPYCWRDVHQFKRARNSNSYCNIMTAWSVQINGSLKSPKIADKAHTAPASMVPLAESQIASASHKDER